MTTDPPDHPVTTNSPRDPLAAKPARDPLVARAQSGSSGSADGSGVPEVLSRSVARRFSGAALIYGATYLVAFVVGLLTAPHGPAMFQVAISLLSIVAAFAVGVIVWRRPPSARAIERLAGPFLIAGGLGIVAGSWGWEQQTAEFLTLVLPALPQTVVVDLLGRDQPGWLAVWILIFPFLVPLSFRRMVVVTVITGSLGVLVPLLSVAVHGLPDPVRPFLADMLIAEAIPTFICVGMAMLGSRVISGLTRDITRARRLGAYQLVERLGAGGMGEVWTARHRMLVRPAAIKLIRPDTLCRVAGTSTEDAQRMLKRFEREVQVTSTLTSPHTIQVYDFGMTDDGTFYYVMELLRGLDLNRLIARFGPQPPERVVHLLTQACHSLAEAHGAGLVHRDVKPANIYVCRQGLDVDVVKVLDFGLVKGVSDEQADHTKLTHEGIAAGTPAFMAPEMAWGDRPLDGRTDLYALGCVAWWLLAGRLVFEGEGPVNVLLRHVNEEPMPPSSASEFEIPGELDELVLSCLAKDPDRRPASAREMTRRLAALESRLPQWTPERALAWWRSCVPDLLTPATWVAATPPAGAETMAVAPALRT